MERSSRNATRNMKLNFRLELTCSCKPPICPHAGRGIARLLKAAYAKGREDGAAAAGIKGSKGPRPIGVRQRGSRRTQ